MSGSWPARRRRPSAGPRSVVMTTRYPLDHPGGVETVARALMDCLGGSGERWTVSHVAAYAARTGAARIPLLGDLIAAGRLAARVIRTGDVLLVHGAEYAWGALLVGRLTGRPVVAVWHGVRACEALPPGKNRVGKAARQVFLRSEGLLQAAALCADATVAVSPVVARDLQSRYGIRRQLAVIPNGVAPPAPGAVRSLASAQALPLRVLWVGTSVYNKRLGLALEACQLARARGHDLSLTVVGLTSESASAAPGPSGGWLTWRGSVPPGEMTSLYGRHDILLFPSRREACPMTVLEALAAGLPVIGSAAVQWLIEGAGVIVAGADAAGYADALAALADPERRRRLASAALERARAYSWESCAAAYAEVLDAL
jgi:glycosyltransferase involved in cell wall biosynthesis